MSRLRAKPGQPVEGGLYPGWVPPATPLPLRGLYAGTQGAGPEGETCRGCSRRVVRERAHRYHKCGLTADRWTGGRATDILLHAPACEHWQSREG